MKKVELRKPVYEYVAGLLGRPITPEEHDTLKKLIVEYGVAVGGDVAVLNGMLQKQGTQYRACRQALYQLGHQRKIPETVMAFLEKRFPITE